MPGSDAWEFTLASNGLPGNDSGRKRVRALAAADVLRGVSDWVYSLALVILAYEITGSLAWVAGILLSQASGRIIVIAFCNWLHFCSNRSMATITGLLRVVLLVSLIPVSSSQGLWWAVVVAAVMGGAGAIQDAVRGVALPAAPPTSQTRPIKKLLALSDQISMVAGSIIGGLLVLIWDEGVAFGFSAASSACSVYLFSRVRIRKSRAGFLQREPVWRTWDKICAFRTVVVALAIGAALGISLRVMLVDVVIGKHDGTAFAYALLVGVAGLGALLSPVPVPRLLGKLPAEVALGGMIIVLAASLVFVHVARPLALVVPVVFGCGILAITSDRITETVARRLVPDGEVDEALRLLAGAAITGQVLALVLVLTLHQTTSSNVPALVLAGSSILVASIMLKGNVTANYQRLKARGPGKQTTVRR